MGINDNHLSTTSGSSILRTNIKGTTLGITVTIIQPRMSHIIKLLIIYLSPPQWLRQSWWLTAQPRVREQSEAGQTSQRPYTKQVTDDGLTCF